LLPSTQTAENSEIAANPLGCYFARRTSAAQDFRREEMSMAANLLQKQQKQPANAVPL
jgi:hypothetical protein